MKKEDLDADPQSMDNRRLSVMARNPNHPMHTHAKAELDRRKMKNEGGMKRIATTQSNKADRITSGGKKGLETFKKREIQKETKGAPKGYHFTRSGKLRKGDAGADGPGGAKLRSDPLDKQRSKIPPLPEKYDEPQGQAKRMMSPLQKARMDKEKADRDRDGKLMNVKTKPKMEGTVKSFKKGSVGKLMNEAATPAMKKAADELNSYAKKSGGIDKADFMKTAKMLSTGKAGMALIKWVNGQDTDVYEKILTVMAKHMGKQTIEKMFKVNIREKVQVDEISKKTAQSYLDKTKDDDAWSGTRKANNRLKGAIQAVGKLRKDEQVDEAGPRHTMIPMHKRFGGTVIPKKFDAYKKHVKAHKLDEPTVRMIHKNPDEAESKRMMKNPKYAKAVDMYKAAHKNESVEEAMQVDELKKSTYGSYIKKAGPDAVKQTAQAKRHSDAGDMADKDKDMYKHYAKSQRAMDKAANRQKGIGKAVDKLTKEDTSRVAKVSEANKETLMKIHRMLDLEKNK